MSRTAKLHKRFSISMSRSPQATVDRTEGESVPPRILGVRRDSSQSCPDSSGPIKQHERKEQLEFILDKLRV